MRRSSGSLSVSGHFNHPRRVAADLHRRQNLPLDVDGRVLLIHLPELVVGAHLAELADGFGAQLRDSASVCAAASSRSFSPAAVKARRMRRFTSTSVDEAVDFGERRAALAPAVGAEILNRAALQLGNRAAFRDVDQDVTGARVVDLRQHVERPAFQLRRRRAGELALEQRDGLRGIAVARARSWR